MRSYFLEYSQAFLNSKQWLPHPTQVYSILSPLSTSLVFEPSSKTYAILFFICSLGGLSIYISHLKTHKDQLRYCSWYPSPCFMMLSGQPMAPRAYGKGLSHRFRFQLIRKGLCMHLGFPFWHENSCLPARPPPSVDLGSPSLSIHFSHVFPLFSMHWIRTVLLSVL